MHHYLTLVKGIHSLTERSSRWLMTLHEPEATYYSNEHVNDRRSYVQSQGNSFYFHFLLFQKYKTTFTVSETGILKAYFNFNHIYTIILKIFNGEKITMKKQGYQIWHQQIDGWSLPFLSRIFFNRNYLFALSTNYISQLGHRQQKVTCNVNEQDMLISSFPGVWLLLYSFLRFPFSGKNLCETLLVILSILIYLEWVLLFYFANFLFPLIY